MGTAEHLRDFMFQGFYNFQPQLFSLQLPPWPLDYVVFVFQRYFMKNHARQAE